MPTPSEISSSLKAWLLSPNRVYPPEMTQVQREMLYVLVGHGWAIDRDFATDTLMYKHKSGATAMTVEDAYAINKALNAFRGARFEHGESPRV